MVKSLLTLLLVLSTYAFAHNVLLMIDDNEDGTIYIETGISTGGNAAGSKLIVTERATGRPLWQGVVPDSGAVTIPRPKVPYSVTLNMGEGHKVTQKGPDLLPIKSGDDSTITVDTASAPKEESTEK